jgi:hypothetical protein
MLLTVGFWLCKSFHLVVGMAFVHNVVHPGKEEMVVHAGNPGKEEMVVPAGQYGRVGMAVLSRLDFPLSCYFLELKKN